MPLAEISHLFSGLVSQIAGVLGGIPVAAITELNGRALTARNPPLRQRFGRGAHLLNLVRRHMPDAVFRTGVLRQFSFVSTCLIQAVVCAARRA